MPPLAITAAIWRKRHTSAAQQHTVYNTMMIWCQHYSFRSTRIAKVMMNTTDCGLDANDSCRNAHCCQAILTLLIVALMPIIVTKVIVAHLN